MLLRAGVALSFLHHFPLLLELGVLTLQLLVRLGRKRDERSCREGRFSSLAPILTYFVYTATPLQVLIH